MKYQVVLERVVRARSCYLIVLNPTKWKWTSYIKMWIYTSIRGGNGYLMTEEVAKQLTEQYQNWLGDNRIYR